MTKSKTKTKRGWKRYMAVGCNHGAHISEPAKKEVLDFKKDFEPHLTIHLGDALDTTSFRAGAANTPDQLAPIEDDMVAGLDFIKQYAPDLWMLGNHEDRLWKLRNHPKQHTAFAAKTCIDRITDFCDEIGCEYVLYGGMFDPKSWKLIGDTLFAHGWIYNQNANRDNAESMGRDTVTAHTHRLGSAPGRHIGTPMGYSVGTLSEIRAMEYAKSRRNTGAWSGGIVYGEYKEDKTCTKNLHQIHREAIAFQAPQKV